MKLIPFLALLLAVVAPLRLEAQQPQTHKAPMSDVNVKYVNGVAPGYAPTPGSGLVLNLGGGTSNCGSGAIVQYAGGTLTMSANTTNYIYLNTASSCVPAVKTATFSATDIPLAIVTTSGSAITGINDVRTLFTVPSGSTQGNQYTVGAFVVNPSGDTATLGSTNLTTDSTGSDLGVRYLSANSLSAGGSSGCGVGGGVFSQTGCIGINYVDGPTWYPGKPAPGNGLIINFQQYGPGLAGATMEGRGGSDMNLNSTWATQGIHNSISNFDTSLAIGDFIPYNSYNFSRGGVVEYSDQGLNGTVQSNGNFIGHPTFVIATGGTGAQHLTFSSVSGCQGGGACVPSPGTFLLYPADQLTTYFTSGPTVFTAMNTCATFGTSWLYENSTSSTTLPVTTAWGCAKGVNINPNTAPDNPVPETFTLQAGSGLFAAGDLVTVLGNTSGNVQGGHYEQATIISVSGTTAGAQTITLRLATTQGDISIWKGGLAGRFLVPTAVTVASAGTAKMTAPIGGSLDGIHIIYGLPEYGGMVGGLPLSDGGDPTKTDGSGDPAAQITLQCGAKITALNNLANVPDTNFSMEPNGCAWAAGQSADNPDYFAQNVLGDWHVLNSNAVSSQNAHEIAYIGAIGGMGAGGSSAVYDAENGNSGCWYDSRGVSFSACANVSAPTAFAIGRFNGFDSYFGDFIESVIAPGNSLVKVVSMNPAQTKFNIFQLPYSTLSYSGTSVVLPATWVFGDNGTGGAGDTVSAGVYVLPDSTYLSGLGVNSGILGVGTSANGTNGGVSTSRFGPGALGNNVCITDLFTAACTTDHFVTEGLLINPQNQTITGARGADRSLTLQANTNAGIGTGGTITLHGSFETGNNYDSWVVLAQGNGPTLSLTQYGTVLSGISGTGVICPAGTDNALVNTGCSVVSGLNGLTGAVTLTAGSNMSFSTSGNTITLNASGGGSGITQLTGDGTAGPGSGSQALTLATVNTSPGSCGDATHVCQVTTNGKGLVTGQTAVSITAGSVSGSGTVGTIPIWVTNTTTLGNSPLSLASGQLTSTDPFGVSSTVDPSSVNFLVNGVTAVAPSAGASIGVGSGTITTPYFWQLPTAAGTGIAMLTNSSNVMSTTILGVTGSGNVVLASSPTVSGLVLSSQSGCLSADPTTHVVTGSTVACPAVADSTLTISSGTQAANSCTSPGSAALTGVTTSMAVLVSYTSDPGALTGWGSSPGMVLNVWPYAADTVYYDVCNTTGSSITYSAITVRLAAK